MKEAHEIINEVHEAYKGIGKKLAILTGKSSELFNSHGREPKSDNPLQSGNKSPVTHYIQYVLQNEAAIAGAGQMLNNRVHAALADNFNHAFEEISQSEIHAECLKESFDVLKVMGEKELTGMTLLELRNAEKDCAEMEDAAGRARAHVLAELRKRTAAENTIAKFKKC